MRFMPVVKKDLKLLLMDKGAIVVLFLLPIMFISVMSFALMPVYSGGEDNSITIPLINHDNSKESKQFIDVLSKVKGLHIITTIDGKKLVEETTIKLVKEGKYPMVISIPEGFSDKVIKNEKTTLLGYADPAQYNTSSVLIKAIEGVSQTFAVKYSISNLVDEQVVGINKTVDARFDEVQQAYKKEIDNLTDQIKELTESLPASAPVVSKPETPTIDNKVDYKAIKKDLQEKASSSLSEPPIIVDPTIGESNQGEVPDSFQQSVPGYTVMFAFFIVMFAGRSFLNERSEGTFRRILSAPISRWNLFAGKLVPNYIIGVFQTIIMFAFGHFAFGMSLGHSLIGLIVISLCLAWASSCLGMLIASLVKTEAQVTGFSMMIVLTLAALGGTMVPLFIMPDVMQTIAMFTPHAWALTGYQDLLVRGMGLSDVMDNALVLFGFGLVFLLISLARLRFVDY
ncbi:ABC transporter permease [Niallia sp. 03133]|uniref:ABC transporter permease n=1 Tax=Niallia sp. 03133 TaxID=3458060 RepID=UPI004044DB1B